MRKTFGTILMILGTALTAAALSLFLFNQSEAQQAQESAAELMPLLAEQIQIRQAEAETQETLPDPYEIPEMTVVDIDGYGYIGYLSIPALGLELPVMADWSDSQLAIAPCRYAGSLFTDDLVIMAHNYTGHFGSLSRLSEGDSVVFVDMDGDAVAYEVVALDVLAPTAVEEMTSGAYDLTLFTCTYGGQNRVSVYCDRTPD